MENVPPNGPADEEQRRRLEAADGAEQQGPPTREEHFRERGQQAFDGDRVAGARDRVSATFHKLGGALSGLRDRLALSASKAPRGAERGAVAVIAGSMKAAEYARAAPDRIKGAAERFTGSVLEAGATLKDRQVRAVEMVRGGVTEFRSNAVSKKYEPQLAALDAELDRMTSSEETFKARLEAELEEDLTAADFERSRAEEAAHSAYEQRLASFESAKAGQMELRAALGAELAGRLEALRGGSRPAGASQPA